MRELFAFATASPFSSGKFELRLFLFVIGRAFCFTPFPGPVFYVRYKYVHFWFVTIQRRIRQQDQPATSPFWWLIIFHYFSTNTWKHFIIPLVRFCLKMLLNFHYGFTTETLVFSYLFIFWQCECLKEATTIISKCCFHSDFLNRINYILIGTLLDHKWLS